MKILVTGSKGFIGKNLILELKNQGYKNIYEYDIHSTIENLKEYTKNCEFVFHLAGINRPKDEKEFLEGNFGFTNVLLENLKMYNNKSTIMLSSSIQAELDNPYGKSKKAGEDLMFNYEKETGAHVLVYRFPNVFGKWAKPNYNSAIATFSHNIANGIPIIVNNSNVIMSLIYIDDLIKEMIKSLRGNGLKEGKFYMVKPVYQVKLGDIVDLLYSFRDSRNNISIPNMSDEFTRKLYANYLSYLPTDKFSYELKMNSDNRGSFTEFFRTIDRGQISVNISKPGIIKGNHWHHTKNEKFLVVRGDAIIRFRKIGNTDVIEYHVSGDKLEVVDIPPGYTHNIQNVGEIDMVTIMWASEPFDPNSPDTNYEEV